MHMEEREVLSKISKIRELSYIIIEEELESKGFDGVQPSHGNILSLLFQKKDPVAISMIVEHVGKAKSTLTSNLHTLEKYGYIEKTKNLSDSRSTLISLTVKGRRLMPVFRKISEKVLRNFYGDMEPAEKQVLLLSLEKIVTNLNRSVFR